MQFSETCLPQKQQKTSFFVLKRFEVAFAIELILLPHNFTNHIHFQSLPSELKLCFASARQTDTQLQKKIIEFSSYLIRNHHQCLS